MPSYTAKPPVFGTDDPNNPAPNGDAVLTPSPLAVTPPTTTPGIIAGAQQVTTPAAAQSAGGIIGNAASPFQFKDYNGQQVMVGQNEMDNIKSSAELQNKLMGTSYTPQEYDKMLNPSTYGARWGLSPDQQGSAPAYTPATGTDAAVVNAPGQWKITPDQTVAGQMKSLIDPNNPYYQQWATTGAQEAAARGFTGNSSIRDSGILDAVMRGALPIATADAATTAKAAGYNADMPNQFALKNADLSQQNALAHLSADTQLAAQKMSITSQQLISQQHDANSVLIQSNDAAKSAYGNYVAAVAQIDQNEKMDESAKRAAIITQTQIFNNAIAGMKSATPGTADVGSPLDIGQMQSANEAAKQVGDVDVSNLLRGF